MKKILAIIVVIAMVCTSLVLIVPSSASAAGLGKVTYAVPADETGVTETDGVKSVSVGEKATLTWAGLSDMGIQTKGSSKQLGLGPKADAKDAYVKFTFDVTKAGEYELTLEYAAKESADGPRVADIIVNDGEQTSLEIATNDDWNKTMTLTVKAELNEGTNTVVITNPAPVEDVVHKYINVSSLTVKGEGVVTEEVDFVEPLAAYDFQQGLEDLTGKHDDIVLDAEHSLNAELKDGGIDFTEGYFLLPDDLFTDVPEDEIEGFTYSMTLTTHQAADEGGKWSRVLFAFSSDNIPEPVGEDSGDDPNRAAASFYASWSGNVGTARRPYSGQGNWLDGCMWWVLHWEQRHVYTLTYDVETNTVKIYVDGNLQADSSAPKNWETLASLTAADIKSFKVNSVGKSFGGNWAERLASMLVEDVTVYSKPLSEDQIKLLNAGGYEALLDGDHVMEKITDNEDGTHTISCTNEGCSYSVVEDCASSEKDCTKDGYCDKCGSLVREAGKHVVEKWEDAGNGLHKGTCTSCGEEVTAPHTAAERTDCTEDIVCKDCGAVIAEGCADHAWSEWKDDGEGHHVRTCQNEWCDGEQTEAHTYTDEMNVCPKCGAANPNFKAPETDPGEKDPGEKDPGEKDPEKDPGEKDPGKDPGENPGQATPPQTGDPGIALFVTLAVVSAASIAITAAVPGKKRH